MDITTILAKIFCFLTQINHHSLTYERERIQMNKQKLTQGLGFALELLTNTQPPLNKIRNHQQAVEALETIKEWAKDAAKSTLQEEIERTHQLFMVGVGHPEWDLPGRVVLMSFWMKNTPANARMLAALEVVEPHFTKITENLNQQVAQHGLRCGYRGARG